MNRHERGVEFETTIGRDGTLRVPAAIVRALREGAGQRVRVRLTSKVIADGLGRVGVTEQEVERVAAIQREPREQVITFLLSEGALVPQRPPSARRKGRPL
jgi:hypothetical protein